MYVLIGPSHTEDNVLLSWHVRITYVLCTAMNSQLLSSGLKIYPRYVMRVQMKTPVDVLMQLAHAAQAQEEGQTSSEESSRLPSPDQAQPGSADVSRDSL